MTDIDKLAREIADKVFDVGGDTRSLRADVARLGILEGMKLQRERDAVIAESCDSMEGHGAVIAQAIRKALP